MDDGKTTCTRSSEWRYESKHTRDVCRGNVLQASQERKGRIRSLGRGGTGEENVKCRQMEEESITSLFSGEMGLNWVDVFGICAE
jgi:hypothetical protein